MEELSVGPEGIQFAESKGFGWGTIFVVVLATLAIGLVMGVYVGSTYRADPVVVNNSGSDGATLAQLEKLGAVDQMIGQQLVQVMQRVDTVAANHNKLVGAAQLVEQRGDTAIRMMEQAIMRLHGEAEWKSAVAYVQAKLEEETERAKEEAKDTPVEEPAVDPAAPAVEKEDANEDEEPEAEEPEVD